jgi:hypothetical protein
MARLPMARRDRNHAPVPPRRAPRRRRRRPAARHQPGQGHRPSRRLRRLTVVARRMPLTSAMVGRPPRWLSATRIAANPDTNQGPDCGPDASARRRRYTPTRTRTSRAPCPTAVVLIGGAGIPGYRIDLPARRGLVRQPPRRQPPQPPVNAAGPLPIGAARRGDQAGDGRSPGHLRCRRLPSVRRRP